MTAKMFLCCLCYVFRVSLADITHGLYVDIVKFLILRVHFHYYDISLLQQIYPTLTNVDLFIVPEEWFTIRGSTKLTFACTDFHVHKMVSHASLCMQNYVCTNSHCGCLFTPFNLQCAT